MVKIILLLKFKALKAQLQYPLNFVIEAVGTSCIGAMDILLLLIPAKAFHTIGGWNFYELGFMFALWKMAHGIHAALFIPFWWHDNMVRNGEFDRYLVRPVHPIWQILTQGFSAADALSEWMPSVTMFVIMSAKVKIAWNISTILFLLIILFSGAVIEWAVSMFVASFSFWFTRTGNLRGIAHTFLFRVTHYPAHIYGRVFAFILTFVFPYAFMAYYPTHYFFHLDVQIFYGLFPYLTPVVAVVSLLVAFGFWSIGLRKYESSGT